MKFNIYFLSFLFCFSTLATPESDLELVKKGIIHKDAKELDKLLVTGENTFQVIENIQSHREELIKLAESSELYYEVKEKLGEKKFTKWKRIGLGSAMIGYATLKFILGSVYASDELDTSEDQGLFSYERVTDVSIGAAGAYWMYYGITDKDPKGKLETALNIVNLLKQHIPE